MRVPALALLTALALALAAGGCGAGQGTSTRATAIRRHTSEPGGEQSIERFGSEAVGAQRTALLSAFHGYLTAIGTADYPAACDHLSARLRRSLRQLFAGKGLGCPQRLSALLSPGAAAIARRQAGGQVTKVRVEGDRAFIVLHAPGAKLYQLTMARQDGRWKAATVAASILVPSAAAFGH